MREKSRRVLRFYAPEVPGLRGRNSRNRQTYLSTAGIRAEGRAMTNRPGAEPQDGQTANRAPGSLCNARAGSIVCGPLRASGSYPCAIM